MTGPSYKIIRSNRKTLSLEVGKQGMLVRAPLKVSDEKIHEFVFQHQSWLEKHLKKAEETEKQRADVQPLTEEELHALADKAVKVIPERVRYYAQMMGVTYGRITIRCQRTRWGSCSSKGNLNFNCLLMLTPLEVLDSVVMHELCHRKEMNHSPKFYAEVFRVCPDYEKCHRWLKENSSVLLARLGK